LPPIAIRIALAATSCGRSHQTIPARPNHSQNQPFLSGIDLPLLEIWHGTRINGDEQPFS
jgi:hypothetical protein